LRNVHTELHIGGYEPRENGNEFLKREDRGYEETGRLKVQDKNPTLFPIEHLGKNWVKNKFMYAHYA
jgi:hypothetical protein